MLHRPHHPQADLGARVVAIATQEWNRWNQGAIKESSPRMRPVLEDYWRTGVGFDSDGSQWWSRAPLERSVHLVGDEKGRGRPGVQVCGGACGLHQGGERQSDRQQRQPFKAYRVSEVAPQSRRSRVQEPRRQRGHLRQHPSRDADALRHRHECQTQPTDDDRRQCQQVGFDDARGDGFAGTNHQPELFRRHQGRRSSQPPNRGAPSIQPEVFEYEGEQDQLRGGPLQCDVLRLLELPPGCALPVRLADEFWFGCPPSSAGVSRRNRDAWRQRSMERSMRYDLEIQPELFEYEAQPGEWEAGVGEWERRARRSRSGLRRAGTPGLANWKGSAPRRRLPSRRSRAASPGCAGVQDALNRVLGLQLTVDGVVGPATRSAIRTFQQRQGLAVDGVVGPATEAALRAALAGGGGGRPRTMPATAWPFHGARRFRFDRDRTRPNHAQLIERIAQCIVVTQPTRQPVRRVRIIGHTDKVGDDQYNVGLGQRRAEAVQRDLRAAIERISPGLSARLDFTVGSRGELDTIPTNAPASRKVEDLVEFRKFHPRRPLPRPPRRGCPPFRVAAARAFQNPAGLPAAADHDRTPCSKNMKSLDQPGSWSSSTSTERAADHAQISTATTPSTSANACKATSEPRQQQLFGESQQCADQRGHGIFSVPAGTSPQHSEQNARRIRTGGRAPSSPK